MKTKLKKKGQALGGLSNSAIAVIILIMVVSVGATVLWGVLQTTCPTASPWNATAKACTTPATGAVATTESYNITVSGLGALVTYSNFFSVIVVVVVFAVIIGLFAFFAMRGGRGGGEGI